MNNLTTSQEIRNLIHSLGANRCWIATPEWKLYFTSITDFFVVEFKADFKFLRDSDRKVTGFSFFGDNAVAKKVD
jgi:hypothetical protein